MFVIQCNWLEHVCYSVAKSKLSVICEHREQKLASAQAKIQALTSQLEAETKKCKAKSDAAENYMRVSLHV